MQKTTLTPAPADLHRLHTQITHWFDVHGRDLPWRRPEAGAWGVMVSEYMLQQTPVVRVLPVWHEWMERWPTPADLAAEPSGEALRAWGKLGYPRRALRLHAAAQRIVEDHDGEVPGSFDELISLPGVGDYTAAAIACFAFGAPETVVDTNIRRVHARAITGNALPEPSYTAAEARLAAALMPPRDAADPRLPGPWGEYDDGALACRWNAAVMELGALVCTARNPKCDACPVASSCAWIEAGQPAPHYTPKGQPWAGTDRQVRGAFMAVLRGADAPLGRDELVAADVVLATDAKADQLERCLASLLADGLAHEGAHGISLPH
ncbi:A/G-specific adenine glycosylase [Zhihengliuella halotolerans]|uniref:Adenine DNA glycosylase n=1 Tax=Zhihengliuella halotolerans TaxID=370736 RepID=A0A4Q8AHH8_9MICC|nr:A/G-specific DNA-adenine glycosylase [Zhihengliuella halotolerans]